MTNDEGTCSMAPQRESKEQDVEVGVGNGAKARGPLAKLADWLEAAPGVRVVKIVEPFGVFIGVIALVLAAVAFLVETQERRAEREVRGATLMNLSWQALRDAVETRAKGNRGQVGAAEWLVRYGYSLASADLHGIYLQGARRDDPGRQQVAVKLQGADLREASLRGVNLRFVDLSRADLTAADLSHAVLSHVTLSDAHLYGINLSGAELYEVDMKGRRLTSDPRGIANEVPPLKAGFMDAWHVTLSDASAYDGQLPLARISHSDWSAINLVGAYLPGSMFSAVDLRKASFYGANLAGVRFSAVYEGEGATGQYTYTDVTEARFEHAELTGADLGGTKGLTAEQVRSACYWDETVVVLEFVSEDGTGELRTPATWTLTFKGPPTLPAGFPLPPRCKGEWMQVRSKLKSIQGKDDELRSRLHVSSGVTIEQIEKKLREWPGELKRVHK